MGARIYFLECAEIYNNDALIYFMSAPKNIRCADLFYECAETSVIV